MANFRLSPRAETDLERILATSEEWWGADGRRRYAAILAAGMRKVALDPQAATTRERNDLLRGVRSFHVRHARGADTDAKVRRPVHVLYYRVIASSLIEIVRVLHERMEPTRHIETFPKSAD